MKLAYINHVTLTTGHVRKTYPREINKEIYFKLNRILQESISPNGAELFAGYRVKITRIEGGAISTVLGPGGAPVLTTLCTRDDDGTLWQMIHEHASLPIVTDPKKRPQLPYIADKLEIGATMHMDAMSWTGDFARSIGWAILDPSSIR